VTIRSKEIGGELSDRLRSKEEICDRVVALGIAMGVAFGAPAEEMRECVLKYSLSRALTPAEHAIIFEENVPEVLRRALAWQSERATVLLWALNWIKDMPDPGQQCSTAVLHDLLPPFGEASFESFRKDSKLRSEDELFDMAILIQELHAVAAQRKNSPRYRPSIQSVNREVIQERHHAINWIVGYLDLPWDEVSRDI
jgi:hypothetical protein